MKEADEASDSSHNSLVVYAARNEELVGPLIAQFEEQTGINLQVKYGGTSELAVTLLEEGKNSPADVFYARDPSGLGAVSQMFDTLPDDILRMVPDWARSSEGKWVGTSARARVVVYNTENVSESDLPDSMEGFTDPRWKGRIGWSPNSGPTQTMLTAMRVLWGEGRAREWLKDFMDNEPVLYPNHTATVVGVAAGETDIGFVNHYYLHRFVRENGADFPARNYHLANGGPGNLVMVAGAGILTTATNRENAETFLRFLLSAEAQRYLTEQALDYPLLDGVPANGLLEPLSEMSKPHIDQALLGDIEGTLDLMRELEIIP